MSRFNAPSIITDIPDIAKIYEINEDQGEDLDQALSEMDDNIFLEDMHESQIVRWENILKISPLPSDTWDDRRFRVQTKALERLPYSIRVVQKKLETLCPSGYELILNDTLTYAEVKIDREYERLYADVYDLIDRMFPLNIAFIVTILYNRYNQYDGLWTHDQMGAYTHLQLRYERWAFAEYRDYIRLRTYQQMRAFTHSELRSGVE